MTVRNVVCSLQIRDDRKKIYPYLSYVHINNRCDKAKGCVERYVQTTSTRT